MEPIVLAEAPLEGAGLLRVPNLPQDADGNVDTSPEALEKALRDNPPDSKNLVVYGGYFPDSSCVLNTELVVFRRTVLPVLEALARDMYSHLAHQCGRYPGNRATSADIKAAKSRAKLLFGSRLLANPESAGNPDGFRFDTVPRVSTSPAELAWRTATGLPEYSKWEAENGSDYVIPYEKILEDVDAVIPADIQDKDSDQPRARMKWRIAFFLDLVVTLQRAHATLQYIEAAEDRIIANTTDKKVSYASVASGRYPRQSMRDMLLDGIRLASVRAGGIDEGLTAGMQAELDAEMREFEDLADDPEHRSYMSTVDSTYMLHDIVCAGLLLDYEAAVEKGVAGNIYRLIDLIGARVFIYAVQTLLSNAAADMHMARSSLAMHEPVGDYVTRLEADPEAHIELPDPLTKGWNDAAIAFILDPKSALGNEAIAAGLWRLFEITDSALESRAFFTAAITMLYLRGMFISYPRDGQGPGRVESRPAAKTVAEALSRIVMTGQHGSGRKYVTARCAIGEFMDSIQMRHIVERKADDAEKKGMRGNVREGDMPFLGVDVWKYAERVQMRRWAISVALREAADAAATADQLDSLQIAPTTPSPSEQ